MKIMKSLCRAVILPAVIGYATIPSVSFAQAIPPLEAYGKLPNFERAVMSEHGKLALLGEINGERSVLLLDENMKALNLLKIGDIKVRSIGWAGEDYLIVTRSDTQELGDRFIAKQAEFYNRMVVPTNAAEDVRVVFANDRSMMNASFGNYGVRQINGRWYGYYGGIALERTSGGGEYFYNGASVALYRVDLANGKSTRLTSPPANGDSEDWLLDGEGKVAATAVFNKYNSAWEIVNAQHKVIAQGTEPDGDVGLIAYSSDGTKVIYYVQPDNEESIWYEVPLSGGSPTEFLKDVDVDEVYTDRRNGRIFGYLPEGENANLVLLDEKLTDKGAEVYSAFAQMNGRIRGWTPDFDRALISTKGNRDSGTWYLVDTVTKSSRKIGSERPQIGPAEVGPISTITYNAGDGLEIDAVLTLPPGKEAKNLPIVMLPHGGPQSYDVATFDWWAQAFASRGYAVIQPNFRGSTNKDLAFMNAGNGEWGKKMQTDLSDAINYLAGKGMVDPSRACIVGASYGGYAALAGVTLQRDIYRCAVSVGGVSDLKLMVSREYRESGSETLRDFREETMGPRETLDAISPRDNAGKASAPILLIHGRDDTVVPFQQSAVMEKELRRAGKDVKLVELQGEDHWLSKAETRNRMLSEAVAFVEKYNPAN